MKKNKHIKAASVIIVSALLSALLLSACEPMTLEEYQSGAPNAAATTPDAADEGNIVTAKTTEDDKEELPEADGGEDEDDFEPDALLAALLADGENGAAFAPDDLDSSGTPSDTDEEPRRDWETAPLNTDGSLVTGKNAVCYDLTTNTFLYGKNIDDKLSPGGVTKLVTALVAYNVLRDDRDALLTVGSELDMLAGDAGKAGLKKGQQLSLETALAALLVGSGSDAAYTLAACSARYSTGLTGASDADMVSVFVEMMNDYVKELGCDSTTFKNPDGYDDTAQLSTARDILKIAEAAATNSLVAGLCAESGVTVEFASGGTASYSAKRPSFSGYDLRGLRAGYTAKDGYAYAALAFIGEHAVISFVSGCASAAARDSDSAALLSLDA